MVMKLFLQIELWVAYIAGVHPLLIFAEIVDIVAQKNFSSNFVYAVVLYDRKSQTSKNVLLLKRGR